MVSTLNLVYFEISLEAKSSTQSVVLLRMSTNCDQQQDFSLKKPEKLIELVLCLHFSESSSERSFSTLKWLKTRRMTIKQGKLASDAHLSGRA